jgi:hypothetical protein
MYQWLINSGQYMINCGSTVVQLWISCQAALNYCSADVQQLFFLCSNVASYYSNVSSKMLFKCLFQYCLTAIKLLFNTVAVVDNGEGEGGVQISYRNSVTFNSSLAKWARTFLQEKKPVFFYTTFFIELG